MQKTGQLNSLNWRILYKADEIKESYTENQSTEKRMRFKKGFLLKLV